MVESEKSPKGLLPRREARRFRLKNIRRRYEQYFKLAKRTERLALELIPLGQVKINGKVSRPVRFTLVALYVQIYRLYSATVTLCDLGLDTEALILLRSLMETVSYLIYIAEKDHDERLLQYRHSAAMSEYIHLMDFLKRFPEDKTKLDLKFFEKANDEALCYYREKHGPEKTVSEIKKKYALKPNEAARSLGAALFGHYQLMHRDSSRIAHGEKTLDFLGFHGGETPLLNIPPSSKWIGVVLQDAMAFVCLSMEQIDPLFGSRFEKRIAKLSRAVIKAVDEQNRKIINPEG